MASAEEEIAFEVAHTLERICPHLAGRKPAIQGAILAQLLALWVGAHRVEGDDEATGKLRAEILAMHLVEVDELISTQRPKEESATWPWRQNRAIG